MVVLTDSTWAACSVDLLVASMAESWVAARVGLMDATSAVCSVVVMGVPWVVAMDASKAAHWVESLAAEKDVMTVAVSVDSKVAMRVALTDA